MPTLTSIAEQLLAQAKQIDAHIEQNNLPPPSFDNNTLSDLPPKLQDVCASLAQGSNDLKDLTRGPMLTTIDISLNWTELLALRVIYTFDVAKAVPLNGTASYSEISSKCGLREELLFRTLRVCMSYHLFDEDPVTGRVCHTASSRLLATSQGFADTVGLGAVDVGPNGTRVIDAWKKWDQDVSEQHHTAHQIQNDIDYSMFEFLRRNPDHARRFASTMHFLTRDDSWDLRHLLAAYDWAGLDRPGATIVDVGGGNGQLAQFLARSTEKTNFIVQDLPHVIPDAKKALPVDLDGRVVFEEHDFLTPEKLDAPPDAFLLRWILHDWPDAYCVRILNGLVPAMAAGTKVLIYEYVLDDKPVRDLQGRFGLQLDMVMMSTLNGRERARAQYHSLLEQADERFVLEDIRKPEGAAMSLVIAGWKT